MKFQNRYGSCELTPIGGIVHISEISNDRDVPDDIRFGIDDGEKLALITGNKDIQVGIVMGKPHESICYVMVYPLKPHQDMVQLAKITALDFAAKSMLSDSPQAELNALNRSQILNRGQI
jgi:hypothetical protein